MEPFERDRILEEAEMLKILLDFHVQNRGYISMNDYEFEEYTNAVLDRLNELIDLLGDKNEEE
jgi:ribosome assembly protein YihI (activator of Der GTPase)